ncbi:unnamed protein product [Acanthoscelides obtectus]|uniref:Uncharacterized protein n=1 Tax=Acanthoscelides obtectus TaxID=200917 RepID=A0A9P0PZ92_ACAOB|nr:unnamed protein product [Acanthoscelides obtectus]CAK1642276.1 hypothetical protein AOBTE_LOCUS12944 [Acanthoscelides obtectus]
MRTIRDSPADYSIAESRVDFAILQAEPCHENVKERKECKFEKAPCFRFDNEKRLVKHILKLGEAGFPPNRQAIRMLAYQFAGKLNLKHNEMAKGACLKSFIERNPELSTRQAERLY